MKAYLEIEMPKNCFDCPCYHHKIDDGYYDYEICRASGTVFNDGYSSVTGHKDHIDPFKARLDNCPLVPIPEHGRQKKRVVYRGDVFNALESARIIALDGILTDRYKDGFHDGLKRALEILANEVQDVPTIIPASEEGELWKNL